MVYPGKDLPEPEWLEGTSELSSQPFLTEEQRAALDAALQAKQQSQAASSSLRSSGGRGAPSDALKSKGETLQERHKSRSGRSGRTKKDGSGGKYTWGNALAPDEYAPPYADRNDPNFDSDDDEYPPAAFHSAPEVALASYKETVTDLIQEYFSSGDQAEALTALEEAAEPELHHYFVKKLLTMSLDKHDHEREMASVLLSALYSEVISPIQMQKGFTTVVEGIDDLQLDVPNAVDMVANFIVRGVVDDILPPSFVKRFAVGGSSSAAGVREKCEALTTRHATERMLRCWGSGAGMEFQRTKDAITNLLQEYVASQDLAEATRCLGVLAVPFFHHELVKQALLTAMQEPRSERAILDLFANVTESGIVSLSQMVKGFQRVSQNLEDTLLDNPHAPERFRSLYEAAVEKGWVDSALFNLPEEQMQICLSSVSSHSVQAFKQAAILAIKEYFESSDDQELARLLSDLQEPGLQHIFVKHLIQLAMDRKDREREMASLVLPILCPEPVSHEQVALGFKKLLAGVQDLALDIPDAARLLSLFLGRAIVDEVLAPSFLTSVLSSLQDTNTLGVSVVQACGALLGARHAAERFLACWHGGSKTVDSLRRSLQALLDEYIAVGDIEEAGACLRELDVPSYHHEIVKRALIAACEDESHLKAVESLLARLSASGEINQTQMSKGFSRFEGSLDDLLLDVPAARDRFALLKEEASKGGWLQPV